MACRGSGEDDGECSRLCSRSAAQSSDSKGRFSMRMLVGMEGENENKMLPCGLRHTAGWVWANITGLCAMDSAQHEGQERSA